MSEAEFDKAVAGKPAPPASVHLCDYPQPNAALLDRSLNERMAAAQLIVRLGHKLREDANLRVRQPLAELQYASSNAAQAAAIETLTGVVADELNVKQLTRRDHLDELVHYIYKPNLKTVGPKYGKLLNTIKQHLPQIDPRTLAPLRAGRPVTVTLDGHEITLQPEDVTIGTEQSADWVVADDRGLQIALSTHLTPELIREGMARDFVRHVQQLRKDANLEIEDRIRVLYYTESDEAARAIEEWSEYIRTETQAIRVERTRSPAPDARRVRIGDVEVAIWIERKSP